MRLALAQINPTVGDIAGNAALIAGFIEKARQQGAELVVFPELCLCGYPPKDLLLQEGFIGACADAARSIGESRTRGITAVFGVPLPAAGATQAPGTIANSLLAYRDGALVARYDKRLLPTYDVFDEDRYFTPGNKAVVVEVPSRTGPSIKVGLAICEDLWKGEDAGFSSHYTDAPDPMAELGALHPDLIVTASASPYVLGKGARHREILRTHAARYGAFVASVNQVGGNDDLVFDGHSCLFDPRATLVAALLGFREDLRTIDLAAGQPVPDPLQTAPPEEQVFSALVLGVRDYCRKTGFKTAILGLSGGIDSALTAVIGVAALGAANITGFALPGPYSSEHSKADAYEVAKRLGIACPTLPIDPGMEAFKRVIDPAFSERGLGRLGEKLPDLTEENLQSRLRGTMLMTWSNRSGAIVLTTGNKSELAVGYCTLYGDMNGGLAVLSDVSKQLVYRLSRWINANPAACGVASPPIPQRTIDKPPSAELAPNQTDQDSLPPYDVLDEIIERYVEGRQSPARIAQETRFDPTVIDRVARMIDLSEYKRKQAAVGLKVTSVAFGSGRRVPIAQKWRPLT